MRNQIGILSCALLCASPALAQDLGGASNFAVLGLGGDTVVNGDVEINSATSIFGNVGYGAYTTSHTNQKVDLFVGGVFVHSTADFNYTAATFNPSGGIHIGSSSNGVDAMLEQATADALAASSAIGGMAATHTLGSINDTNVRIESKGFVNIIEINAMNLNEDVLELVSRTGSEDYFIFNVLGDFTYSKSRTLLNGTTAGHVLFNFLDPAADVMIKKQETEFEGTILAPSSTASIEYHNPASFNGAIIAYNIDLHSDFNLNHVPFISVPAPGSVAIAGLGGLVCLRRRRR